MGKRFFFRFFRLLFKGGGVCLFKKVVYGISPLQRKVLTH